MPPGVEEPDPQPVAGGSAANLGLSRKKRVASARARCSRRQRAGKALDQLVALGKSS